MVGSWAKAARTRAGSRDLRQVAMTVAGRPARGSWNRVEAEIWERGK